MSDDPQRPESEGAPPPPDPTWLAKDPRPFLERTGISPVTFASLVVIVLFVLYQVVGTGIAVLFFDLSPTFEDPVPVRALTAAAQLLFLLVPSLLAARLTGPDLAVSLGLRKAPVRIFLAPLVGIVALQQLLQVYLVGQEMIPLPPELEKIFASLNEAARAALVRLIRAGSVGEFLGVVAVICVIPGVVEEVAFRGVVQRNFVRGVGPSRGIAITAIIFAAFHFNPGGFVPLAALGAYLGFVAWRAGSLWVSIVAHAFNNFIPVLGFYTGFVDEKTASGTIGHLPFGTLMLLFWFSGVVFVLSTYYFLHQTRMSREFRDPAPP